MVEARKVRVHPGLKEGMNIGDAKLVAQLVGVLKTVVQILRTMGVTRDAHENMPHARKPPKGARGGVSTADAARPTCGSKRTKARRERRRRTKVNARTNEAAADPKPAEPASKKHEGVSKKKGLAQNAGEFSPVKADAATKAPDGDVDMAVEPRQATRAGKVPSKMPAAPNIVPREDLAKAGAELKAFRRLQRYTDDNVGAVLHASKKLDYKRMFGR